MVFKQFGLGQDIEIRAFRSRKGYLDYGETNRWCEKSSPKWVRKTQKYEI